jgi:hypothetical protein
MFEYVLQGIPSEYKKRFFDNMATFKNIWAKEVDIRNSIRINKITLYPLLKEFLTRKKMIVKNAATLTPLYRTP